METWKVLPECAGIYEVSDAGNLRRIAPWSNRNRIHGLMHPHLNSAGYRYLGIQINGKMKKCLVHRMVALAFIGPCLPKHCVNHLNGNRQDNRLENLEYVTYSQNVLHSYRVLGATRRPGSKHPLSKLTEDQVIEIRGLRSSGIKIKEIAAKFGIAYTTAASLSRGSGGWKHLET